MIIRDPQSGVGMNISDEGYGRVGAACIPIQFQANWDKGNFYSAVIEKTPTGAGDCFFYIKNDDSLDLIMTSIKLQSASAESIQVKLGDSGTAGGTHAALTPVSRNAGSGKTADVTCESGVDITGLSGGSIVDLLFSNTLMIRWGWESRLVIPKNSILSLYAVTGAVAVKAILGFYFCEECL
jgi:hypothetical protein